MKVLYMQIIHLSREVEVWFDSHSLARAIYALQRHFKSSSLIVGSIPQPLKNPFHITTPELLAIR